MDLYVAFKTGSACSEKAQLSALAFQAEFEGFDHHGSADASAEPNRARAATLDASKSPPTVFGARIAAPLRDCLRPFIR